jgi:hypothetical protein
MRQRNLLSNLSLLRLNFVTAHWSMCHPILDGCDGRAVALSSSSHIVEEHWYGSWKERLDLSHTHSRNIKNMPNPTEEFQS